MTQVLTGTPGARFLERLATLIADGRLVGQESEPLLTELTGELLALEGEAAHAVRDLLTTQGGQSEFLPAGLEVDEAVRSTLLGALETAFVQATEPQDGAALERSRLEAAAGQVAKAYGDEVLRAMLTRALDDVAPRLNPESADWLTEQFAFAEEGRLTSALMTFLTDAVQVHPLNLDGDTEVDATDALLVFSADGNAELREVGALSNPVRVARAVVDACYEMTAAGHAFALIADHAFSPDYWTPEGRGTFALKAGVQPSDALKDIFAHPRAYRFECATGLVIALYKAALNVLGEDDFNRVFTGLRIGPWQRDSMLDKVWSSTGTDRAEATPEEVDAMKAGDYAYFRNWDVTPQARKEGWQGENVLYLGRDQAGERLFYGHPFGVVTQSHIVLHLNGMRNPGSQRSASFERLRGSFDADRLVSWDETPAVG